jgi:hypothetical protein
VVTIQALPKYQNTGLSEGRHGTASPLWFDGHIKKGELQLKGEFKLKNKKRAPLERGRPGKETLQGMEMEAFPGRNLKNYCGTGLRRCRSLRTST